MAIIGTLGFIKLIQSHNRKDQVSPDDDCSSCYDDIQPNQAKQRFSRWGVTRKRPSSSAVYSRSSNISQGDALPPSPTHAFGTTDYVQQVHEASELLEPDQQAAPMAVPDPASGTPDDQPLVSNSNEVFFLPSDLGLSNPAKPDVYESSHVSCHRTSLPIASRFIDPNSPSLGFLDLPATSSPHPRAMEVAMEKIPDPALRRQSLSLDLAEGVRQLIRETDEASDGVGSFEANSTNIPDTARLPHDPSWSDTDLSSQLAPGPLLVTRPRGEGGSSSQNFAPPAPRRPQRPMDAATRADRRKSRSVPPPVNTKRASVPPGQYGRGPANDSWQPAMYAGEPRTQIQPQALGGTQPLKHSAVIHRAQKLGPASSKRPKIAPRWAMPGNVSELLSGQVFKRNKVHELLTPQQVEALKLKRQQDAERRQSDPMSRKSVRSEWSLTVSEPALDSRTSGGARSSHASEPSQGSLGSSKSQPTEPEIPEVQDSEPRAQQRVSSSGVSSGSGETCSLHANEDADRPPTPPRKSPRRYLVAKEPAHDEFKHENEPGLRACNAPGAPSPPEGLKSPPLPPKNPQRSRAPSKVATTISDNHNHHGRGGAVGKDRGHEEDDQFVYLRSTPYSLTMPGFRHGAITFLKSEIGKGALTMDETLDWTSFQMAILGAGELVPEVSDDSDSRTADDIRAWFDEFGFETHGELVPEFLPASPRNSSHSTISSRSSVDGDLPVQATAVTPDAATGTTTDGGVPRLRYAGARGQPPATQKRPLKRQDSTMPPIVVSDEDGGESPSHDDGFAFGSNLQGDLGDFLKWEAEHAFAGSYYGP